MITFFLFLLGATIGSFINLCALRIPNKEPICIDRSACPQCKHVLGAKDLIPIFSFLILKGACRYCQGQISWRYFGVEVLTGLLFVATNLVYGITPAAGVYLVMTAILLVAALIDLVYFYIPNRLVLLGLITGILLTLFFVDRTFTSLALGCLMGGVPMLGVYIVSQGGMGAGDVKLSTMLGVFLGWRLTLVALFLGFLSGAVVGTTLLATGRNARKDPIPFGPFLAFGAIVASLYGSAMIDLYLKLSGL